ncbi:hypothetical protein P9654_00630 [Bacillus atrophaeus]|uniref:hypothetical protein n=1 Tax=Bacillus atrophaeus TaxID=1452 RepID=UPI000A513AC8|nr:hypothetical protein [Bacillus atrophaeus]
MLTFCERLIKLGGFVGTKNIASVDGIRILDILPDDYRPDMKANLALIGAIIVCGSVF